MDTKNLVQGSGSIGMVWITSWPEQFSSNVNLDRNCESNFKTPPSGDVPSTLAPKVPCRFCSAVAVDQTQGCIRVSPEPESRSDLVRLR